MKYKRNKFVNKKFPKFICLIGIDGSGKTTIAKKFILKAKELGYSYKYSWVNNQPILMYFIRFFWHIYLKTKGIGNFQSYDSKKKKLAKNIFINSIYSTIHCIDYKLWVWLKVKLPLKLNKRVIIDRYYYDVAINYFLLNQFEKSKLFKIIAKYQSEMPVPDIVFVLDVPIEISLSRKDDVPSKDYLIERKALYQTLKERFSFKCLDGTKEPELIINQMLKYFLMDS